MVSAAVGFQCPECVAEGRRSQPAPRTVTGGVVHARQGVVTTTLVATCAVVYGLQILIPTFSSIFWLQGLEVADGQVYRLVTSGFLHGSLTHILFNMYALWVVGRPMEALLGRVRFVTLYMVCLFAGSTASYLLNSPTTQSLGASGAIFGLFGGMIVVARRMRWNLSWLIGLVAINLALPFVVGGIDWHAHVGGLVTGVVVTAAMAYAPQPARVAAAIGVSAAVVALCAGLVVWRGQQIREDPRYAPLLSAVTPEDFRPLP
ncbi:MAG: rhomboid family intramembrane serine protease [Actinomycetes bacterium]